MRETSCLTPLSMEYFLENIARSVNSEFGNTLNRHCLVFPNRRAGLYFMKYLAAKISKPVWAPAIYTVNELFRSYSSLQIASNEVLLFELYKVYRRLMNSPERFDDFYFWGDMLLDDFDDVDKYLVDAQLLFRNVSDIKTIDQQFGGLSDYQIEIIKKFWVNFDREKLTREKSGFIDIWSVLNDLYIGFRHSLKEQNIAYEGMIFREMAENKGEEFYSGLEWYMVHFIGFNALNECEKVVMQRFRKAGKARFYWDYDNSYIINGKLNSAGFFMRENLKQFGNDMPSEWVYDTLLSAGSPAVRRRVFESSSDVAQVKILPELVNQLPDLSEETAHNTAIILADENLLMPVLTSLPENIGDINITMGYPIKHSLVYTLIRHLMELQRNASFTGETVRFGYKDVIGIMKHPLMAGFLSEADKAILNKITETNLLWVSLDHFAHSTDLEMVFTRPATSAMLSLYFKNILSLIASGNENKPDPSGNKSASQNIRNEFIYRVMLSLNRLETIVNRGDVFFSTETYMRILDKLLRIQSVPFSGEPLSGIQIMGILETRALDFKNLIILSVNEGVLPSASTGSSFIPFSLREAFRLPSFNHQESIYAYHFYRLLQRAENVTFLYNSNSEGLRTGEMSRFLVQMKYDSVLKPEFLDLSFEIKSHGTIGEKIERTEEHINQLNSQFLDKNNVRILSPSAINTWLNCRMKFYYRYVNGLKEPEYLTKDIDPAMLGEILHNIMKKLYNDFIGEVLTKERIDLIIRDKPLLERTIINSIGEKFGGEAEMAVEGNELIIRDVLLAYVLKILRTDKSLAPFSILYLESAFSFPVSISSGDLSTDVSTGGKVDRIDIAEGVIRIVDYKTGSVADKISSIEGLFADDRKKDSDAWLQTLLYCEAFLMNNQGISLRPSVYKIKKLTASSDNDKLKIKSDSKNETIVDDYQSVRYDFIKNLKSVIADIFSRDKPFVMTNDIRGKCSYCPYKRLCIR
jgi:CRISPR/Cas system-associated exonuclease Cas4 (RecB family)